MVIGLSGKKQHGKSTVAKYCVNRYGFWEVSWAQPLKEIIGGELFGFTHSQMYDDKEKEIIDPFWGMSPRHVLQIVGTECFRRQICDDFWVKLGIQKIQQIQRRDKNINIVVSDCRFVNEAKAIKELGGDMIRVIKTDVTTTDTHASEIELDNYEFDCVFDAKTGDIKRLHNHVDLLMKGKR